MDKLLFFLIGLLGTISLVAQESPTKSATQPNYQRVFPTMKKGKTTIQFKQADAVARRSYAQKRANKKYPPVLEKCFAKAKRYQLVQLDGKSLTEQLNSSQIELELFEEIKTIVNTTIAPSIGPHGSIFYAASNQTTNSSASITIIEDKVYGKVWKDGQLYLIEPVMEGNWHVVAPQSEPADAASIKGCDDHDDDDACCRSDRETTEKLVRHEDIAHLLDGPITISASMAPTVISNVAEIVTYYNAGAVDYYGSSTNAVNKITQYINETNIAFANSQIDAYLSSIEITYFNSTNRYDAANRRNQLCADIAASVGTGYRKEGSSSEVVTCGNAERWRENGADGTNIVASPSCADGQFTFSHELGHVYEANHYDDSDAGDYRGAIIQSNVTKTLLTKEPGTRVLHYSNPDVLYNGLPTGSNNRRNAHRMNSLAASIANFNGTYLNCAANCQLTVNNEQNFPVELFWNNNGTLVSYGIIAANSTKVQNTYSGHVWEIPINGQAAHTHIVNCQNPVFTINCSTTVVVTNNTNNTLIGLLFTPDGQFQANGILAPNESATYDNIPPNVTLNWLVQNGDGTPEAVIEITECDTYTVNISSNTNNTGNNLTRIQAKVFLEGFYNGNNGLTKTTAHHNLIPTNQPFNTAPWNYTGTESVNIIPPNAVDWILLATRDAAGTLLEQTAGFLNTNGEIMDVEGNVGIPVANAATHFSIHHKSHLAVMSTSPYTSGVYDFTNATNKAMGNNQQIQQGNYYMMYSGDYDCNGLINSSDYNLWQQNGATINQYLNVDGDGSGLINGLDFNLWTRNRSKIGHPPLRY